MSRVCELISHQISWVRKMLPLQTVTTNRALESSGECRFSWSWASSRDFKTQASASSGPLNAEGNQEPEESLQITA